MSVGSETAPDGALMIWIAGKPYSLILIPPSRDSEFQIQARVTLLGGGSYVVTIDRQGRHYCDCPDFIYRGKKNRVHACKHAEACRKSGLLNLTWRNA